MDVGTLRAKIREAGGTLTSGNATMEYTGDDIDIKGTDDVMFAWISSTADDTKDVERAMSVTGGVRGINGLMSMAAFLGMPVGDVKPTTIEVIKTIQPVDYPELKTKAAILDALMRRQVAFTDHD